MYEKKVVISFPHMAGYHIPIKRLLSALLPEATIMPPPPITKKTLELGCRVSPDLVCAPFKYNMGNYIEALESGANVLLQTGIGCRFGYYGEVQETILRDLGYKFRFLCLSRANAGLRPIYNSFRSLGSDLSFPRFVYQLFLAVRSIGVMDRFEYYSRQREGFESTPGSFEQLNKKLPDDIARISNFRQLRDAARFYEEAVDSVTINRPHDCLKVAIVGELFTVMESFCNFYIERELIKNQIMVTRKMNVTFLLGGVHSPERRKADGYLCYNIGANGADSVAQSRLFAEKGYDGIIHMKSFGCTPEINAIPALQNIARDYKIPILFLSFDTHTGETGLQTRLEAFIDMIAMRRNGTGCKR